MEKQIQLPESCDSESSESGESSCSERVSLSSEEESLILHLETEEEPEDEPPEDLPKQSNEEVEMNNLEIQVLPSTSSGITWKRVVDDKERSPDEETPDEERSDLEMGVEEVSGVESENESGEESEEDPLIINEGDLNLSEDEALPSDSEQHSVYEQGKNNFFFQVIKL